MATTGTLNIPTPKAPYETEDAVAKTATATGYDPSAFTVDRKQTVAGQLEDLIDKDSSYIQQAERRAAQQVNDRGLLNSSIGVGAGRVAAIESALPIATTDAGTFNQAHTNTINAQNAAKHFTAGAKNTASLQDAQLGTQVSLSNATEANKAQADAYQADTQIKLATLDAQTRTQLAHIDGSYRQLLQSNSSAQAMFNQIAGNIAQIAQSTTLDQAGKDNAIQSQINMLNEGLQTIQATSPGDASAISQLNLGQFFQSPSIANSGPLSGPRTQQNFDWQGYLERHPDVAQWVRGLADQSPAGRAAAAWHHYENYGKNTGWE